MLLFLSEKLDATLDFRLIFILIVLLIVFLGFNMRLPCRKHTDICMGDSGSTFIAFSLVWFAIDLSQRNSTLVKPITMLWIIAFPIFNLINVIVLRLRKRKSALSFLLGLFGLGLNYFMLSNAWQFIFWIIALILYIYIVELTRKPLMIQGASNIMTIQQEGEFS